MAETAIVKTRRNHALEHATVALMLDRGVRPPLGGYSVPGGFFLWSRMPKEEVTAVVEDALELLNQGHHDLAISPYCGTNMAVGVLFGGLAASIVRGRGRGLMANLRGAAAAIVVAALLNRPLGELLQRKFTTKADATGMSIGTVRELLVKPVNLVWVPVRFDG